MWSQFFSVHEVDKQAELRKVQRFGKKIYQHAETKLCKITCRYGHDLNIFRWLVFRLELMTTTSKSEAQSCNMIIELFLNRTLIMLLRSIFQTTIWNTFPHKQKYQPALMEIITSHPEVGKLGWGPTSYMSGTNPIYAKGSAKKIIALQYSSWQPMWSKLVLTHCQ